MLVISLVAGQIHREQQQSEEQLERGDADACDDKAVQSILAVRQYRYRSGGQGQYGDHLAVGEQPAEQAEYETDRTE